MNQQKLCLYDVEWQALRISLLGRWNNIGTAADNSVVNMLDRYLWQGPISSDDIIASRLYRVLNLLNAVRMSNHGSGHVGSTSDDMVVVYRDGIQDNYNHYIEQFRQHHELITWEVPTEQSLAEDLELCSQEVRRGIIEDLKKRYTFAIYKQTKGQSRAKAEAMVKTNRPELTWVLSVCNKKYPEFFCGHWQARTTAISRR